MVKMPKVKSLDKKNDVKVKPKLNKVKKASNENIGKVQKNIKSTLPTKGKKKSEPKQQVKQELIKEAVQEAKNVVPLKKVKDITASKEQKTNSKQKTARKPLILAPLQSPDPTISELAKSAKEKSDVKLSKKEKKSKVKLGAATNAIKSKKNAGKPGNSKPLASVEKVGKKKQKSVKTVPLGPMTKAQVHKDNIRSFQKIDRAKNELKKTKKIVAAKFEALPFDEEKFAEIVTVANIKKVGKALKEMVEKEVATKKTSIFSDYKYILTVGSFKIANCPKRVVKLNLKHSLVDKDDDVVVIVPDLQRGAKVDYDPTIQHYEDVFREAGVEGLTIMPFNQLRTECNTYEAVRKFSNTYDFFLCDGRLVGHASGFCGKIFQKPRTTLHAVRLDKPNSIKGEIEKSLRRTAFRQLMKGDLIAIPVGTHKHSVQQLAENVEHVVEQLKILFPGGLSNIRNMHLKIDISGTSSLPIYISMAQPPEHTPYVVGSREQRMLKIRKDANDVLSKFTLTKEADMLKLNKTQVERKRKLQETRQLLKAEGSGKVVVVASDEPQPTKKTRKDGKGKVREVAKKVNAAKKKSVAEKKDSDNDESEDEEDLDDNSAEEKEDDSDDEAA